MRRRDFVVVAIAVLMTLVACSERPVGAVVADTPRDVWRAGESVELRYDNHDTLSLHSLGVVMRREMGDAEEGAVVLLVTAESPSGMRFESEVVVPASERHGGGSFAESAGRWVEDARLREEGEYTFIVAPTGDLKGVWSVGVELRIDNGSEAKRF